MFADRTLCLDSERKGSQTELSLHNEREGSLTELTVCTPNLSVRRPNSVLVDRTQRLHSEREGS